MIFDSTLHLGDLILGIVTIIIVPVLKLLASTILQLRDTVQALVLRMEVISEDVAELKQTVNSHNIKIATFTSSPK